MFYICSSGTVASPQAVISFFNPQTGALLARQLSPANLPGPVSLALTSGSEKTMILYADSGTKAALIYWNLQQNKELRRFEAPPGLKSPIIFANFRFFAGINASGLQVCDATNGNVLGSDPAVRQGILASSSAGNTAPGFILREGSSLYPYTISTTGLAQANPIPLSSPVSALLASSSSSSPGLLIGLSNGGLSLLPSGSTSPRDFSFSNPLQINEAAVSGLILAYSSQEGIGGVIPLDYRQLHANDAITTFKVPGENRVSLASGADPAAQFSGSFLYWQDKDSITKPLIVDSSLSLLNGDAQSLQTKGYSRYYMLANKEKPLNVFTPRYPLIEVSNLDKQILFLDSGGTTSVYDGRQGKMTYSYSSVGTLDAAFLDSSHIIIGRSAASASAGQGGSAFLRLNILTGETVAMSYGSSVGVRLYRTASGQLLAGVVNTKNQASTGSQTELLQFNVSNTNQSQLIDSYQGEDTTFSIADISAPGLATVIASTLGGQAKIYRQGGAPLSFERSYGYPLRLEGGLYWFLMIDTDGSLCWYDTSTGKLLALLHIYNNVWQLEISGAPAISGPVLMQN
jgi:hypothetical protein